MSSPGGNCWHGSYRNGRCTDCGSPEKPAPPPAASHHAPAVAKGEARCEHLRVIRHAVEGEPTEEECADCHAWWPAPVVAKGEAFAALVARVGDVQVPITATCAPAPVAAREPSADEVEAVARAIHSAVGHIGFGAFDGTCACVKRATVAIAAIAERVRGAGTKEVDRALTPMGTLRVELMRELGEELGDNNAKATRIACRVFARRLRECISESDAQTVCDVYELLAEAQSYAGEGT